MKINAGLTDAKTIPLLSILIINWNSRDDLIKCLDSLRRNDLQHTEIIVIDNASSDGSVAAVQANYPEVHLQVNETNLGHTGGANQGFGMVSGQFVLLLDSDTILPPGSVRTMIETMRRRPEIALAAPTLINVDGTAQESTKRFPNIMSAFFGRHSTLTRLFPNNPFSRRYLMRDKVNDTEPYPVDSLSSACMLFRRSLLDQVGLWDTEYPGYWVDIDWCFTLSRAGCAIYSIPGVKVVHDESYSPDRKKGARRIWMFHQGAYRLYAKHYTRGALDPRRLLALLFLSARAGLVIAADALRSSKSDQPQLSASGQPADTDARG